MFFFLFFSMVLAFITSTCGPKIGPASTWIPADQIEGPLKPELAATPPAGSQSETSSDTLRITTFNVHHGEDTKGIASAIKQHPELSKTDVLFLQEIRNIPNEGPSRASRIAHDLEMAYVYAPAKEVEGGTHGLAILSRFPLEEIAVMELPAGELLVNNERRIALSADIQLNRTTVRLINVHLDTRLNASERIMQLRPAVIDAPIPSIIAGDFNTNPLTWAFNAVPLLPLSVTGQTDQAPILDDYMRSIAMTTPTAEFGETVDFPVVKPRLDSIFLRGLENGDGAVERNIPVSDHWPLWLDVRLKQN